MKILIVIPARGGSKGIPKKNIRLMNGEPLISYAIKNARACQREWDVDVVVDTDDDEITKIAKKYGGDVNRRPKELAGDDVTLDPVIINAYNEMKKRSNCSYDYVITLQPTSPTLKSSTLIKAVSYAARNDVETLISVINDPHLSWSNVDERMLPDYKERVNRQLLPPHYRETGGFLITKAALLDKGIRLSENIQVFELPEEEAIDIDGIKDWVVCESILKRKKIIFRADGYESLGMGHIYRCITLAYQFIEHDVEIVTNSGYEDGVRKLEQSRLPYEKVKDTEEFLEYIKNHPVDIVVNDVLNTEKEYVQELKRYVPRVINFEDQGEGAIYADAVINAIYDNEPVRENLYSGFKYFVIRDEFLRATRNDFHKNVKNVLAMFGGSDPSNMSLRIYKIFQKLAESNPELQFHIITGIGYLYKDELKDDREHNIYVHNDVEIVSEYMEKADLAITSQGRTIYELACMGVPSIVLAQNARETTHIFANLKNGFINLGIGKDNEEESIINTIDWLIHTPKVREEMRLSLLEKNFYEGPNRVRKIILGE